MPFGPPIPQMGNLCGAPAANFYSSLFKLQFPISVRRHVQGEPLQRQFAQRAVLVHVGDNFGYQLRQLRVARLYCHRLRYVEQGRADDFERQAVRHPGGGQTDSL